MIQMSEYVTRLCCSLIYFINKAFNITLWSNLFPVFIHGRSDDSLPLGGSVYFLSEEISR